MKALIAVVLYSLAIAAANAALPDENQFPRLTDVAAFPEKDRQVVTAIVAAVSASGANPNEYFVSLSPAKNGTIDVFLKYQTHDSYGSGWRGDPCGRCRITTYDPKTGKIAPFQGYR